MTNCPVAGSAHGVDRAGVAIVAIERIVHAATGRMAAVFGAIAVVVAVERRAVHAATAPQRTICQRL